MTRQLKSVEEVKRATLEWVHWHDTGHLHGYHSDVLPTEFEAAFYATHGNDQTLVDVP